MNRIEQICDNPEINCRFKIDLDYMEHNKKRHETMTDTEYKETFEQQYAQGAKGLNFFNKDNLNIDYFNTKITNAIVLHLLELTDYDISKPFTYICGNVNPDFTAENDLLDLINTTNCIRYDTVLSNIIEYAFRVYDINGDVILNSIYNHNYCMLVLNIDLAHNQQFKLSVFNTYTGKEITASVYSTQLSDGLNTIIDFVHMHFNIPYKKRINS